MLDGNYNKRYSNSMKLYLYNNDFKYAVEQMILNLFPGEKPEYPEGKPQGDRAEIRLNVGEKRATAVCTFFKGEEKWRGMAYVSNEGFEDDIIRRRMCGRIIKLAIYRGALKAGMKKPVWGALTGIRPTVLMSRLIEEGRSERAALTEFIKENDVSKDRAELCLKTARESLKTKAMLGEKDVCLYVGIPFCPTRCSYCSFVSQSVSKSMKLIPEYLKALSREIDATAKMVKDLELRPIALYLGGGTPTTLNALQLDELMNKLEASFDFSAIKEITVEAGRPDTISIDKLKVLKAHNVTRVSVNPQTMDDKVLEAIGRKHTAAEVIRALKEVREVGGIEVNMDLIAGLPLDTPETFKKTLDTVLSLAPENITVHTLALKKGSRIMLGDTPRPSAEDVGAMLYYSNDRLSTEGYEPYYLYRQKYMSGGFENVGWQKANTINLYNICIMEELCSIISMGGGASTKLILGNGRIERVFDPKYPQEYINGIDKIISDKEKIKEFLWHTN